MTRTDSIEKGESLGEKVELGTHEFGRVESSPAEASDSERDNEVPVLSELDQAILDFESKFWKKTAVKERAIAQSLGIAPIVYYQRLIALTRMPEALTYAPAVVRRLIDTYEQRTSGGLG